MGVLPSVKNYSHAVPAVILLGSNLDGPDLQIKHALNLLATSCGRIVRCSHLYRSSPWGYAQQDYFLNQAVLLRTPLPPLALLKRLQFIEQRLGRIRNIPLGPRVIDLDILVYGGRMIAHAALQVPHLYLPDRRFALIPLNDIWSSWMHPATGMNAGAMLRHCKDQGIVERL